MSIQVGCSLVCVDCGARLKLWDHGVRCDRCSEAFSWRKLQGGDYVLVERGEFGALLTCSDSVSYRHRNLSALGLDPESETLAAVKALFAS